MYKSGQKPEVNDYVIKDTGDAQYEGWVVSVYETISGNTRVVVDVSPQGFQMICNPKLLRLSPNPWIFSNNE